MAFPLFNREDSKDTFFENEYELKKDVYWTDLPVKAGECYKVSGYNRSHPDEKKDAAVIIFDFGDYEMDEVTCRVYGLKKSNVGIYSYLPVGDQINAWSFNIVIPEEIDIFRIGLRTWKNRKKVFVGRNINISKDATYSKIFRELQQERTNRQSLHFALMREKQATQKVRQTLSFRLGYILVHALKSWKNFIRFPFDLLTLFSSRLREKRKTNGCDWRVISEEPFTEVIAVEPNSRAILHGRIMTDPGEKKNAALVRVEFPGLNIAEESAKRLGLRYSNQLGFYNYLPTGEPKEQEWRLSFQTPIKCSKVSLTWMAWYNRYPIQVSLERQKENPEPVAVVGAAYVERLKVLRKRKGSDGAEKYIRALKLPSCQKADLYEALAEMEQAPNQGPYFLLAFHEDPSYARGVKMFRRIVDAGLLETAGTILDDFEVKAYSIRPSDMRNVNYARGYVSLYRRLPKVPEVLIPPPEINNQKVLMYLHASLPHHSNGYAIRSHAILTALSKGSRYSVEGLTRSGYPQDVGIQVSESVDVIDNISYTRINEAHYYEQPIDNYIMTAANDLQDRLVKTQSSIVHAASAFYTGLPALIAARRLGLPFVYEVRGLWEVTRASTIPGWGETERFTLERDLETMVAGEADQVIAITEGVKREMIRRGVAEDKISVIPNAINKGHFKPILPNLALKKQIGLKDVPTIGYVGSIVDYEGLDILVQALALLKRDGIAFNFLLIGDGNALAGIRRQVISLGLEDEAYILGRVPHQEVPEYYSLIDITPFPRKALPVCEMVSPLKPFEAMVQEKVVIASNVDALKEIVQDGKTGLLFEKERVEDLAEKLKDVVTNRALHERLAKEGKNWVLANREWSKMAPYFDVVYDKAFEQNRKRVLANIQGARKARALSLLVYGDLNLNYVDGSAVWACSLVEMLAGLKNVSVTFLLKADLTHDTLIKSLKMLDNVTIISPLSTSLKCSLLKPDQAVEVLEDLQLQNRYDGVILRGFEINKRAAEKEVFKGCLWPYLIDVFHIKDQWDDNVVAEIKKVVEASYTLFCQTDYIRDFLEDKIPSAKGKTSLLPPMVPDQQEPKRSFDLQGRPFTIVYAGKFAPLWGTREMLATFRTLRKDGINVELHVYGDKIHNPQEDPSFKKEVEKALGHTEGLVWHKAQPRAEVIKAMRGYDLAWAWRRPELEENTDEVSTKFLEYSSVGLPMLSIGNKITLKLLGKEYPLFADSFENLVPTIKAVIAHPEKLIEASSLVYKASGDYSFSAVRRHYIEKLVTPLRIGRKHTILFAGHDLKFVEKLIRKFEENGHKILVDQWQGHNKHDEGKSLELLKQADVIFCEWCLGNATWYSHNKLPHQKMVIRFHRQEIETEYPAAVNFNAVEKMAFIVPHIKRKAIAKFSLESFMEKCTYIPNYVDMKTLDRPKTEDARFNLGIVGIVPRMKRFDRALDILEGLRQRDKRYRLFVKGKLAKEYPWMRNRPDELVYFEKQEKRIECSPYLKDAVYFDGFGKDMDGWFQKIGYILSTSDFEGSHLSVAEGMATGSSPVIITWDGATEIYPKENCFEEIHAAIQFILNDTEKLFPENSMQHKAFVKVFDIEKVYNSWSSVLI